MNLIRWNPFRELESVAERFFGRSPESVAVADWLPAVDVSENDTEYVLKAELPGVTKENVKVTVEDGVLQIEGERKLEKEEKTGKFHRVERSYGSFTRSFVLPEGVEADKVRAEFKDGVLNVHVPKAKEARPKGVDVKIE